MALVAVMFEPVVLRACESAVSLYIQMIKSDGMQPSENVLTGLRSMRAVLNTVNPAELRRK